MTTVTEVQHTTQLPAKFLAATVLAVVVARYALRYGQPPEQVWHYQAQDKTGLDIFAAATPEEGEG